MKEKVNIKSCLLPNFFSTPQLLIWELPIITPWPLWRTEETSASYKTPRWDNLLKGQCHEIFCFWFFSWISFPPAPEYPIRTVLNFFENSRRYSQVKVCHRYQRHRQICHWYQRHWRQICHRCKWHRWQIMGTISGCWDLKVNLNAKMYL